MSFDLQKLQDETNAKLAQRPIAPELDAARMKAKGTLLRNSEKDSLDVVLHGAQRCGCNTADDSPLGTVDLL